MKIMLVSDVHGSSKYLDILREIYYKEKPDKIIFLGDMYYGYDSNDDLDYILNSFNNMYIVKGNCDSEYDVMTSPYGFMDYYYFEAFNKKIYCTHGNRYNMSRYPNMYFDVLVSGHTHRGLIEEKDGKLFLNPGSISYPRGGSVNSFMITDDNGIYLKDLEENILDKKLW